MRIFKVQNGYVLYMNFNEHDYPAIGKSYVFCELWDLTSFILKNEKEIKNV